MPGSVVTSRSKWPRSASASDSDREVRVVASLNHPNICTVYDVGPNYLVMELVDGKTLRDWFRGALPVERSARDRAAGARGPGRRASGGCRPSRPQALKT
jgi:hypothetical protein